MPPLQYQPALATTARCPPSPSVPFVPTCPAPALLSLPKAHPSNAEPPLLLGAADSRPSTGSVPVRRYPQPPQGPCKPVPTEPPSPSIAARDPPAAPPAPAQRGTHPHGIDPNPVGSPLHGGSPGCPRGCPGRRLSAAGGCRGPSRGFSSGLSPLPVPGADSLLLSRTPNASPNGTSRASDLRNATPETAPRLSPNQERLQHLLGLQPPPPKTPTHTPLSAPHNAAGGAGSSWGQWCPMRVRAHGRMCRCSSTAAPEAAAAPGKGGVSRWPGCTGGSPGTTGARRKRSFTRVRLFVCLTDESFPDRCASPHLPTCLQLTHPGSAVALPAPATAATHHDPPTLPPARPRPHGGDCDPTGTREVCPGGRTPRC